MVLPFILKLVEKLEVERKDVQALLAQIPEAPLCKLHHNQTRQAHDRTESQCGDAASKSRCLFSRHGCRTRRPVLRRIVDFSVVSLDNVDAFIDFKHSVHSFTNGNLDAAEVQGQPACSNCIYVISRGKEEDVPEVDATSITDPVDRVLVDLIWRCVDNDTDSSFKISSIGFLGVEEKQLNAAVITPADSSGCRLLPFSAVVRFRNVLVERKAGAKQPDRRTMESKIRTFPATKKVPLYRITPRLRYYASEKFTKVAFSCLGKSSHIDNQGLPLNTRRKLLDTVAKNFKMGRDRYWSGCWSLSHEIAAIPQPLWTHFVLEMASNNRLLFWGMTAKEAKKDLLHMFPVCNCIEHHPNDSIEIVLQLGRLHQSLDTGVSVCDAVLAVRVLMVIEQIVFWRTESCAGPVTTCMSIAGIL
ncbi:hypothetical protein BWQ96_09598 [Gracilariopsis chorda]|uniref:Uncharacterized protein n=1 Tax=Gracilariopsis chorda TaxID=448386 RepID=A0A2V3IHR6_9FLOR|nr:hypothetical protein BWQ96_09598 [Gracilariopsis chorda]|eukprot:PXF40680.1 hypothetical protein BWQ96_09598 [Gracilariopsis chorda]